jgi:hypothetical protein
MSDSTIRPVQTVVQFAHTEPCDVLSVEVTVTFAVRDLDGKRNGQGFKWIKTVAPDKGAVTAADCEKAAQAYAKSIGGGDIEAIEVPVAVSEEESDVH